MTFSKRKQGQICVLSSACFLLPWGAGSSPSSFGGRKLTLTTVGCDCQGLVSPLAPAGCDECLDWNSFLVGR